MKDDAGLSGAFGPNPYDALGLPASSSRGEVLSAITRAIEVVSPRERVAWEGVRDFVAEVEDGHLWLLLWSRGGGAEHTFDRLLAGLGAETSTPSPWVSRALDAAEVGGPRLSPPGELVDLPELAHAPLYGTGLGEEDEDG